MPLLSVILPVYNVADYLKECLDSLLCQEGDFEVIAVNDGSTDRSEAILSEYAKKYPRLLLFSKENGGLSDARNFGLRFAKGEYVAFVDSDDVVQKDFVYEICLAIKESKADLITFDYEFFYPSGKCFQAKTVKFSHVEFKKGFLLSPPMAWLRVVKKSLLAENPFQKGLYYEDLELTPRLTLKANTLFYLEKNLYRYRQREGSIMTSTDSSHDGDIFKVLASLEKAFAEYGERYQAELEFLFVEHLLRTSALRFSHKAKKEVFSRLGKTVAKKFPRFRKNPYLAASSLYFRVLVFFTSTNMRWAVVLLKRIKG